MEDFDDDKTQKDTIPFFCKTMAPEDLALIEVPTKEEIMAALEECSEMMRKFRSYPTGRSSGLRYR